MAPNDSQYKGLFPQYNEKLPKEIQARVRRCAEKREFQGTDDSLFVHAFGVVKQNELLLKRSDIFLNLYGFSRNLSFAFIIVGVLVLFGPIDDRKYIFHINATAYDFNWWGFIFILIAVAMFYRYLKFYRQHAYDIFVSYAELETKSKNESEQNKSLMMWLKNMFSHKKEE
jgi:hypothetical protein